MESSWPFGRACLGDGQVGQLHGHLLGLFAVDGFQDIANGLMQISPLHFGQVGIQIMLKKLMAEAIK